MSKIEVPFPPRPAEGRGGHLQPPWVPFEPRWEYKEIVRDLESGGLPNENELNALGAEHWEMAGVASEGRRVHFYFKRERTR
ncbi:MAG TPA: hypothetical protein VFZ87_05940 [Gemmatimonadales bacterium]